MSPNARAVGSWHRLASGDLLVELDKSPAAEAARRKLYHDYLAAVRTLRYLAQKGLQSAPGPIDSSKQEALEKHLKNLALVQELIIDPLLHQSCTETMHDPR